MEMSEFLQENRVKATQVSEELDVQKAVVESLAADKAEQDEKITTLINENNSLKREISQLNDKVIEIKKTLAKMGDVLAVNAEGETSNKIALLDRDLQIEDRFQGETRDHILEILTEAREKAEKEGRIRRSQLIESVLLANVSSGNLARKREEIKKLFNKNGNVLSGEVIEELDKRGISYKNGESYLLVGEILQRSY